jgi:hypothetical protein
MNHLSLIQRSVVQAMKQLGDLVRDVNVAQPVEQTPTAGEDLSQDWIVTAGGKGFWDKIDTADFPGATLEVSDRVLVLLQCSADVNMHDFVEVDDVSYHVFGVNPDVVANTRVLQKLLLRAEPKDIQWESDGLALS